MDVSVVIVSFNSRNYLRPCLRSVLEHTQGVEYEVIVVDNASSDGSAEMVAGEFPQVTLLRRADNAGFAAANNEGIRAARGEAILLLNPDAEFTGNVLPPMHRYLGAHPGVGVLGPKLLDEDGSLQLSCRRFPGFATALFNRYSLATRLLPKNPFSTRYLMTDFDHKGIADVDWVSGACMMLPRQAFDRIGLLDERYFMYIEDVDLCQRAHRAGYKVVYFPEVAVLHHIGRSSSTLPSRSIIERHRSMWHYYKKYQGGNLLLDVPTAAGIGLRCALLLALNGVKRAWARGRTSTV
ncbi:MAG: glycosyltransferase family 2 protein [Dehalococcoidia bacterium]